MIRMLLAFSIALAGPASEPPPRSLAGTQVRTDRPLTHVSAIHELADGRLIVTNPKEPSVLLIEPSSGRVSIMGSPGAGPDQYARPGGLYAGPDGTVQLLDRGRARVLTVSSSGVFTGAHSIAVRGMSVASDRDVDLQRLDARGVTYFIEPPVLLGPPPRDATLVRFDPVAQKKEPIAQIREPERQVLPGGDGVAITREVIGSPVDGWGVAPDGRVAIVRAAPYRVEWVSPDGRTTTGPVVEVDPLPMTDADRQAHAARLGRGPSVRRAGGATVDAAGLDHLFARAKPPFEPDGVVVAPDGRVWVMRTRPFGAGEVVYDVFDRNGRRVDRIQFADDSRVVGFGAATVYVRRDIQPGRCDLLRHTLR